MGAHGANPFHSSSHGWPLKSLGDCGSVPQSWPESGATLLSSAPGKQHHQGSGHRILEATAETDSRTSNAGVGQFAGSPCTRGPGVSRQVTPHQLLVSAALCARVERDGIRLVLPEDELACECLPRRHRGVERACTTERTHAVEKKGPPEIIR